MWTLRNAQQQTVIKSEKYFVERMRALLFDSVIAYLLSFARVFFLLFLFLSVSSHRNRSRYLFLLFAFFYGQIFVLFVFYGLVLSGADSSWSNFYGFERAKEWTSGTKRNKKNKLNFVSNVECRYCTRSNKGHPATHSRLFDMIDSKWFWWRKTLVPSISMTHGTETIGPFHQRLFWGERKIQT